MGFESFYGGRIGASFVIVKRFDGIDIPQIAGQEVYKTKYLATTNDRQYLLYDNGFIERTADNYTDYNWQIQAMDGSTVETKTDKEGLSPVVSEVLDIMPAEGMRQCFEQGGDTTNIVNYGEYVIIDNNVRSNPDNGKVYRRGMNFDYDPDTNPLAGAEYIGQIIGPKGDTAEVKLEHYEDVIQTPGHAEISYAEATNDLVPGSYEDGIGTRIFNDTIEWSQATFRNKYGDIIGCIVGFKIPTLVDDFEATSMSPYEQRRVNPSTGKYENYDLISEDSNEYIDGKWKHPFYQKWQIKIPHGYHGVDSTNLEIVHTKTMPEGFGDPDFAGTPVYVDAACTEPLEDEGSPVVLAAAADILREIPSHTYLANDPILPIYEINTVSCKITYEGETRYVKKEHCYMDIVRYKETNYDEYEIGQIKYVDIGEVNQLQKLTLDSDGTLTAYYSGKENPQVQEQKIEWIDYIDVSEDGIISYYFNTDHDTPAYQSFDRIQYINDLDIETTDPTIPGSLEGSGDQKIHVTYNTDAENPVTIGEALNYILDSFVVPISGLTQEQIAAGWASYSGHLLVYYSDPARRTGITPVRLISFPSARLGVSVKGWTDLGDIRGLSQTPLTFTTIDPTEGGWNIVQAMNSPEVEMGSAANPNYRYSGWGVVYTENSVQYVAQYNYQDQQWERGVPYGEGITSPKLVISRTDSDVTAYGFHVYTVARTSID